jgi:peptide/nickel transport system substrate-binding protein
MALRLAMDRGAMTKAITAGTGTPADDHPISSSYEFWDRDTPIRQQSLEEARRLLKEAGRGDGFEERLVVSNSPASREKSAVVVQALAEQIGINFKIELMDSVRYINTVWNKGVASYVGNYTTRSTEDAVLTKLYSAKYGIDEGRWANPESDAMLEAARRVTDSAKRREIYVKYERLVRDQGPFIIPNFFNSLYAVADYVNNWPARAITTELRLEDCWMSPKTP